ncbi:unnamed protein product [Brassica oleracea]|uniref:(rape) hypothetical protein n=1 Tax=Brassica napus TaxID=3708 RepID=A0A816K550_BRANA|nr:unnamed protein product [Brassica napus]
MFCLIQSSGQSLSEWNGDKNEFWSQVLLDLLKNDESNAEVKVLDVDAFFIFAYSNQAA